MRSVHRSVVRPHLLMGSMSTSVSTLGEGGGALENLRARARCAAQRHFVSGVAATGRMRTDDAASLSASKVEARAGCARGRSKLCTHYTGVEFFCSQLSGADKRLQFCLLPHSWPCQALFRFNDCSDQQATSGSASDERADQWLPLRLRSTFGPTVKRDGGDSTFEFSGRLYTDGAVNFGVAPVQEKIFFDPAQVLHCTQKHMCIRENAAVDATVIAQVLRDHWRASTPRSKEHCFRDLQKTMPPLMAQQCESMANLEADFYSKLNLELSFSVRAAGEACTSRVGPFNVMHKVPTCVRQYPGIGMKVAAWGGTPSERAFNAEEVADLDFVCTVDYRAGPSATADKKFCGFYMLPVSTLRRCFTSQEHNGIRTYLVYFPHANPRRFSARTQQNRQLPFYIDADIQKRSEELEKLRTIFTNHGNKDRHSNCH